MVANPHRQRLILPVAPLGGAALGLMTAIAFALIPGEILDRLILRSGIAAIIAAAEPPLGMTARIVLALMGGGTVALLGWFALFLVLGSRTLALGGEALAPADPDTGDSVPVLRRADAHPDAPSRRPVFANRDLGTPFLEVRARQAINDAELGDPALAPLPMSLGSIDLPVDLDMPLSAFDPDAIGVPLDFTPVPPRAVSPRPAAAAPPPLIIPPLVPAAERRQIFEPTERFETFELTPMVRTDATEPPMPRAEPSREPRDTQATITALLERLERGVTHRNAHPPAPAVKRQARPEDGLQDTLGTLRRMATRT